MSLQIDNYLMNQGKVQKQELIDQISLEDKPILLCAINKDNPYFIEIISSNPAFDNYFGYDKSDIIGENFDYILNNNDDNLETIVEYSKIVKDISKLDAFSFQLNIYNRDNYYESFLINLTSYNDSNIKYCIFSFSLKKEQLHIESCNNNIQEQNNLINNLQRVLRNEKLLRISSDLMLKDESISDISYGILKALCHDFKIDRAILCQFSNDDIDLICEFCSDNIASIIKQEKSDNSSQSIKEYFIFHNHLIGDFFRSKKTKTVIIEDVNSDKAFNDIRDICNKFKISSQLCLSTPVNEKYNMGLFLHQTSLRKWSSEEVEIISTISNQLSIAIQKSIYLEKVMESNKELIKKSLALKNSLMEEKKMRMIQNEFIAMVSHEFKTPLQIIDGVREVLTRKLRSKKLTSQSGEENLSRIKNAILRLHNLISSTLDLSQIAMSNGDLDIKLSILSIKDIIHNIIDQNKEVYDKKSVTIDLDIDKLPDEYQADHKMLDHCLTNIIGNAVKYSPDNSKVKILGALLNDKIVIKVVDQGIGIPKADLKKVGDKFYRAKNTLKISGTGIGLYLTKYFIKLHAGEVIIDSIENKGTEVTIILPIKNNEK